VTTTNMEPSIGVSERAPPARYTASTMQSAVPVSNRDGEDYFRLACSQRMPGPYSINVSATLVKAGSVTGSLLTLPAAGCEA
jgi:hypothetical protein